MLGRGFERRDNPVIVIIRIGRGLREPDDLFGINRFSVNDGRDLSIAPAGVKADAAAVQVPADGLRLVLCLRQAVHGQNLKRMLKHLRHEVGIKGLLSTFAVDRLQIITDALVPADHDAEAALHPENGLDQALDVIAVGLHHLGRSVNKGLNGRHLTAGTLDRNANRLFGVGKKCIIETLQREKTRIQLRYVFQLGLNTIQIHQSTLPVL